MARPLVRRFTKDGSHDYYRNLQSVLSCFLQCFRFSFFFCAFTPTCFSSSCCFVRIAVIICSSTASRCSCVICILSYVWVPFVFNCFVFRSIYFLRKSVHCVLVPGALAFDLPTFINARLLFLFSVSVYEYRICISLLIGQIKLVSL